MRITKGKKIRTPYLRKPELWLQVRPEKGKLITTNYGPDIQDKWRIMNGHFYEI